MMSIIRSVCNEIGRSYWCNVCVTAVYSRSNAPIAHVDPRRSQSSCLSQGRRSFRSLESWMLQFLTQGEMKFLSINVWLKDIFSRRWLNCLGELDSNIAQVTTITVTRTFTEAELPLANRGH